MAEKTSMKNDGAERTSFKTGTACDENSSADELRECTEETRDSVDRSIRRLEERFSPAGIWDSVRDAFRQGDDGSFDLDRTVSRNATPFAIIGSGLMLLGAGVAVYAFSKMRGDTGSRESDHEYSTYDDGERVQEYGTPAHEAEPAVAPPSTFVPPRKNLEEEATTEEIQSQMKKKSEHQEKIFDTQNREKIHEEPLLKEEPALQEEPEEIIIVGQTDVKPRGMRETGKRKENSDKITTP